MKKRKIKEKKEKKEKKGSAQFIFNYHTPLHQPNKLNIIFSTICS